MTTITVTMAAFMAAIGPSCDEVFIERALIQLAKARGLDTSRPYLVGSTSEGFLFTQKG
jgi:hypothetical protein